jgi:hypothetical protein
MQVYFNNFATNANGFSGANAIEIAPGNGDEFLGALSLGAKASLGLSGLPAHNTVTLTFDLYTLNSVDGDGTSFCCGPDYFILFADNQLLLGETFSNVTTWTQSFGGANSPGGTGANPARTGSLGYSFFGPDHAYQLSFTFAHTAATLSLDFVGATDQGWADEGFGIDNVRVVANAASAPVSLPSSLSLTALGLVAAAAVARRRR